MSAQNCKSYKRKLCLHCPEIARYAMNDKNFARHVKKLHPEKYQLYKGNKELVKGSRVRGYIMGIDFVWAPSQ